MSQPGALAHVIVVLGDALTPDGRVRAAEVLRHKATLDVTEWDAAFYRTVADSLITYNEMLERAYSELLEETRP